MNSSFKQMESKPLKPTNNFNNSNPIVYLSRKESFSSAHRLHNSFLTEEENKQIYGKCNNPNGHGHNYIVKVTCRGPIDARTGMVINLVDLKEAMRKVIDKLDHKNLDLDVVGFNKISTTENLAVFFWNSLVADAKIPQELLYEVKISETDKNQVTYRGDQLISMN